MEDYRVEKDFKNAFNLVKQVDESGTALTKFLITTLYELGIDPKDEKISEDMIFITMLFNSALEEYFTSNNEITNGKKNALYQHLLNMRGEVE